MFKLTPFRLFEHLSEDKVNEAARAIGAIASRAVLKLIAAGWGVFLLAVFTLLLTIRIAVTLPLPWGR